MSLLLLLRGEGFDPLAPPFAGPETTVTWAHLLRESKIPEAQEEDQGPSMVSMDRMAERVRYG